MSQNWYQTLPTGGGTSGSRDPLPEGNYNHRTNRSLYIVMLLEPKAVGDGKTQRHTFLVNSAQEKGSAWLKIDLQDHWLRPEAIALAFRKKAKDGGKEPIDAGILAQLDPTILEAMQKQIQSDAEAKAIAANTPEEAMHDAVEKAVTNTLTQIQINVGTIFRLCDWAGIDRNPHVDLGLFADVDFEGSIKHQTLNNKVNAEVSVGHRKTNGAVAKPKKPIGDEDIPF